MLLEFHQFSFSMMSVSSLIPDILNKFINVIVSLIWNFKKPQFITILVCNYKTWLNHWEKAQNYHVLTRTVSVGSTTVCLHGNHIATHIYKWCYIELCFTGPNRPRTCKEDVIIVLKIVQYTKILMASRGCGCGIRLFENSPCALSASGWAPHWPTILLVSCPATADQC